MDKTEMKIHINNAIDEIKDRVENGLIDRSQGVQRVEGVIELVKSMYDDHDLTHYAIQRWHRK